MTTLYVDNIAPNLQSKISAPNLTLPTGSVIKQVQYVDKNHRTWSGSGRSNIIAVPGTLGDGSVFIDRTYNTSKILIEYTVACGSDTDSWTNFLVQYAPAGSGYTTLPDRGQAVVGVQNAGCLSHFGVSAQGSYGDQYHTHTIGFRYLLDPSTTTNKVFVRLTTTYGHDAATRTCYLNRSQQVSDNNRWTGISTVLLTEIAG